MEERTTYLSELSAVQLAQLYQESQLSDGAIDSDYVAGYWAMWAGWPEPDKYMKATEGWRDAIRDAADLVTPKIATIRETRKQIVVYSGTQGGEKRIRHFQKTEKGRAAADRFVQRLANEGYTLVAKSLFDTLIDHGKKKEVQ